MDTTMSKARLRLNDLYSAINQNVTRGNYLMQGNPTEEEKKEAIMCYIKAQLIVQIGKESFPDRPFITKISKEGFACICNP